MNPKIKSIQCIVFFYVFDGEKYSFIIYLFIFFRLFKRSYFITVLSVGMPSIRPLETLHNALSLRQLDAFLEYVTATIFKTPCPSPRLRSPLAEKRSLRGIFGDSSSSKPPSLSQSSRQSSKYFTIFFCEILFDTRSAFERSNCTSFFCCRIPRFW